MRRAQTETFTIKLPLHCESWQQDYLDKLFRVGNSLYNCLVSDRKNALFEMTKTKEWRFVQNELSQLYADINNNAPTTKQKEALAILHARRNNILKSHGFNEYAFMRRMRKWREHQKSLIHSQVAQKIASSVWKQFEAHLYGPRSDIHFKRNHDFLSLEGKSNFTGIRFIKLSEKMVLRLNKVDIPVLMPNNAYVKESLQSRVKYCRIVRIPWRGKHQWLYSLQLVLEGTPPKKNRPVKSGPVGIDIGMQTIAVVSDHSVLLEELAPNANLPYKELRKIQRAIDRSRRVNNPEMFQPSGIITPIHQLSPEYVRNGKRLWKESKQYKVLRQQRRYLYAKLARTRRYQHNEMANRIRTMGDAFYIETMKFEALRKKAPSPPKESGQKCRKRFGASIANKAPATLVNILEMKVQQDRGKFFRINTQKARASQYDHTDKTFRKKSLSTRWTTLKSGEHVQRDLYSALLLQNTNKTLDGFVQENIEQRFHNFMQMHDICINNLRYIPTPSSTGIKQIV